jgi:periplasmic divalent cation tolerance protein
MPKFLPTSSSRIKIGSIKENPLSEFLLVITTVPDEETAEQIARTLVEERLAACVSRLSSCQSSYWWQGKIAQDREFMLFIKTLSSRYPELEEKLVAVHPYDVPEVIAIPLEMGYGRYLDWMREETSPEKKGGSK